MIISNGGEDFLPNNVYFYEDVSIAGFRLLWKSPSISVAHNKKALVVTNTSLPTCSLHYTHAIGVSLFYKLTTIIVNLLCTSYTNTINLSQ